MLTPGSRFGKWRAECERVAEQRRDWERAAAEAAGCVRTPHASYDEPPPAPRSRSGTVRMTAMPERLPRRRDVLCGLRRIHNVIARITH